MKAFMKCSVLLALLVVAASSASAVVGYAHQPPFTPQRTVFWTFGSQDWQTPITATGPTWDTGEWTCDEVTYSSNLQWYDSNSNWVGHQGMIGLDNQTNTDQTVWIKFHINNYTTANALKKFWTEGELITWGNVIGSVDMAVPQGYQVGDPQQGPDEDLNPGFRINVLWNITPNPTWEELTWQAYVPAHSGVLIDKVFVSTACVPEPGSLMALGTGFMGILGLSLRRRRA